MNDKAGTQSITMEFDLPHNPAKVWRALTEPELLARWLMVTDMKLAVGQGFTFKSQPAPGWDGVVSCEMKEIEPQKKLQYSWASLGLPPHDMSRTARRQMTATCRAPRPRRGQLLSLIHI